MVRRDDIPFQVSKTPYVFTHLRKTVERLQETVQAPQLMHTSFCFLQFPEEGKGVPWHPTEWEPHEWAADDRLVESKWAVPFHGGETAALRVEYYFPEKCAVESYKRTGNGLLGTDYWAKFSLFLVHRGLSAQHITIFWTGTSRDSWMECQLKTHVWLSLNFYGEIFRNFLSEKPGTRYFIMREEIIRLPARVGPHTRYSSIDGN